jgi:restriction system protein
MDWTNFTFDKRFSGRRQELDLLARELLLPDAKVVAITGEPGVGKTALAMMFAHLHRDAFPAGTYHLHANSFEPLPDTIAASVSNPTAPYLLILDDLDFRQPNQQYAELMEVRASRSTARIICVSRSSAWHGNADLTLELRNLNLTDFSELFDKLTGFSGAGHLNTNAFEVLGGNPLFAHLASDLLKSSSLTPLEVLRRFHSFKYSGLIDVDGRPVAQNGAIERQIIVDVQSASDDLLNKVHSNPKLLYDLTPRGFEEFVAEILDRLGYEVTLTPASKDGGKDIYAAKKDHLGTFLYVVECKQYAPDRRVGVGLIRELNGVVQAERATAGILATTSFFTRGAKEFQTRLSNQIGLKDYLGIQEWLDSIFQK